MSRKYQIGLCSARKNVRGSKSEIFIKVECKKVIFTIQKFYIRLCVIVWKCKQNVEQSQAVWKCNDYIKQWMDVDG